MSEHPWPEHKTEDCHLYHDENNNPLPTWKNLEVREMHGYTLLEWATMSPVEYDRLRHHD